MKICSKCKIEKNLNNFSKYFKAKDHLSFWCKKCKLLQQKIYRKTLQGIKINKRYSKSFKSKLCLKKYASTDKGKLSRKKRTLNMFIKFPEKFKSRNIFRNSIAAKKIFKRNSCEICLNGPTEGHHEDYRKPLDVIWLCKRCHVKLHQQYKEKGILIPF